MTNKKKKDPVLRMTSRKNKASVANAGVSGKVSNDGRRMKNPAHSEIVTAHNAAA